MAAKLQQLQERLDALVSEKGRLLEPLRKRQRIEEEAVIAPLAADIEALQTEIDAEKEKRGNKFLVVARLKYVGHASAWLDYAHNDDVMLLSVYDTREDAEAALPKNSRDHSYIVVSVKVNQTKEENKLEDSPPSR